MFEWRDLPTSKKKNRLITSIIAIYVFSTIIYTSFVYLTTKKELISHIDQRLLLVAQGLSPILDEKPHSQLFSYEDLNQVEKRQMDEKLTKYANATEVAYVYTLKQIKNTTVFIASSLSPEEQESKEYSPVYFEEYHDRDPMVDKVFATGEKRFAEYTDQWGTFRSIFLPHRTIEGELFVIGVDVPINEVQSAAVQSMLNTLLMCVIFILVTLPVIIFLLRSITRDYQQRIEFLTRDPLTGLPNKHELLKDIEANDNSCLLLVSINRVSDITSVHGPSIGDKILKQFSLRLSTFDYSAIKNMQAYHIHGNDFAIMTSHHVAEHDERSAALKLIKHLCSKDYEITQNESVCLTVDVGGVQNKNHKYIIAEDFFALANIALLEARNSKQNLYLFRGGDEHLPSFYEANLKRIEELKKALKENRLSGFFQAIFSVGEHKRIIRYECLARIVDDKENIVFYPDEFIPYAHRAKLYPKITKKMVSDSIQFADLTRNDVSINISVSDIENKDTVQSVYQMLRRSRVAHKILFELLEDEYISDYRVVTQFIVKMKALGVRFGVDDVGKNYSNFDRLTQLPVDFIKIDGSVIQYVDQHDDAKKVVKQVIDIAHKNNISVVAEYCANEATMLLAESLDVDYLQGFYLAKPESLKTICDRQDQHLLR